MMCMRFKMILDKQQMLTRSLDGREAAGSWERFAGKKK